MGNFYGAAAQGYWVPPGTGCHQKRTLALATAVECHRLSMNAEKFAASGCNVPVRCPPQGPPLSPLAVGASIALRRAQSELQST